MTENKRFRLIDYEEDYFTVGDDEKGEEYDTPFKVVDVLNELDSENKELKDKNSQLQETLAFRSNQLVLIERLVDDLGSEEMARQMEDILE